MSSSRVISPREQTAMIVQLRAAADLLEANMPKQCCANCSFALIGASARTCTKVMQQIPENYHGLDCKMWSEVVPF